jgi:predicted O-methyltransferase YrrM
VVKFSGKDTAVDPNKTLSLLSSDLSMTLEQALPPPILDVLRNLIRTEGRVPEQDLRILISAVKLIQPVSTLEIGLASGSTALAIMGSKSGGQQALHTAVDPYQSMTYKNKAVERITEVGLASYFQLIEKSSHIALPELLISGTPRFDFVYIDGNHKFDYTLLEWFYADQMLNIGGVIAFDDCQWAMVQTLANFVEANCAYKFIKPNERTWLAVKMSEDRRRWFEFTPFVVPWGTYYSNMIDRVRKLTAKKAAG